MATIATGHARHLAFAGGNSRLRGGPEEPNIKETASQTYAAGAALYRDSNGTIAIATAGSNIVGQLCGLALKDATGTTGDPVRYRSVRPGDTLVMNLIGTSTTTTALTLADNKTMFDVATGGKLVANVDASFDDTKPWGRIVGFTTPEYGFNEFDGVAEALGDTAGHVIVVIGGGSGLQDG